MVRGSQSYYDRIRDMTDIGHTTLESSKHSTLLGSRHASLKQLCNDSAGLFFHSVFGLRRRWDNVALLGGNI